MRGFVASALPALPGALSGPLVVCHIHQTAMRRSLDSVGDRAAHEARARAGPRRQGEVHPQGPGRSVACGLDEIDACEILTGLRPAAFVDRVVSRTTGERMYVFKPQI